MLCFALQPKIQILGGFLVLLEISNTNTFANKRKNVIHINNASSWKMMCKGFPCDIQLVLLWASKSDFGTWLDFTTGGNDLLTNTLFLYYERRQGVEVGDVQSECPKGIIKHNDDLVHVEMKILRRNERKIQKQNNLFSINHVSNYVPIHLVYCNIYNNF